MTIAELLRQPRVEDLVPDLASEIAPLRQAARTPPLYVQIPAALGHVVASGLFCGAVVVLAEDLVGVVGGILGVASILLSWARLPWFAQPVVLIGAACCRMMVAQSCGSEDLLPAMIALEATMLLLHRDRLNRAFAAAAIPIWWASEVEALAPRSWRSARSSPARRSPSRAGGGSTGRCARGSARWAPDGSPRRS